MGMGGGGRITKLSEIVEVILVAVAEEPGEVLNPQGGGDTAGVNPQSGIGVTLAERECPGCKSRGGVPSVRGRGG